MRGCLGPILVLVVLGLFFVLVLILLMIHLLIVLAPLLLVIGVIAFIVWLFKKLNK